jgi:hypothetical protein
MATSPAVPTSFEEFWPFYVAQHSRAATRTWHLVGTTLALATLAVLPWASALALVPLALVLGYGCAWIGHFFVEHNRPATFRYPLWSFRGDFRMYGLMLRGRMEREIARLEARGQGPSAFSEGVNR